MGPDVYGFIVDVEEGMGGASEGVGDGSVAGGYVGVVLLPGGYIVPEKCE